MAIYTAIVLETVVNEVRYTIEADSQAEANEKAERGETESEEHVRTQGVVGREVESTTEEA